LPGRRLSGTACQADGRGLVCSRLRTLAPVERGALRVDGAASEDRSRRRFTGALSPISRLPRPCSRTELTVHPSTVIGTDATFLQGGSRTLGAVSGGSERGRAGTMSPLIGRHRRPMVSPSSLGASRSLRSSPAFAAVSGRFLWLPSSRQTRGDPGTQSHGTGWRRRSS
jgi:hypothetical protein